MKQGTFRDIFTPLWVVIVAQLIIGCGDPTPRMMEALRSSGYTDATITGEARWQCGDGDVFHKSFTAKNANGLMVSGVVCCGWSKLCTIRF